jgi:hypothetical protein
MVKLLYTASNGVSAQTWLTNWQDTVVLHSLQAGQIRRRDGTVSSSQLRGWNIQKTLWFWCGIKSIIHQRERRENRYFGSCGLKRLKCRLLQMEIKQFDKIKLPETTTAYMHILRSKVSFNIWTAATSLTERSGHRLTALSILRLHSVEWAGKGVKGLSCVVFRHLPGGIEEPHENPQQAELVCGLIWTWGFPHTK